MVPAEGAPPPKKRRQGKGGATQEATGDVKKGKPVTGVAVEAFQDAVTDSMTEVLIREHDRGVRVRGLSLNVKSTAFNRDDSLDTTDPAIALEQLPNIHQKLFPLSQRLFTKRLEAPTRSEKTKGTGEVNSRRKGKIEPIVTACISVLLNARSIGQNRFQVYFGRQLHGSGASRAMLRLLENLGISVSYDTVHRIKGGLSGRMGPAEEPASSADLQQNDVTISGTGEPQGGGISVVGDAAPGGSHNDGIGEGDEVHSEDEDEWSEEDNERIRKEIAEEDGTELESRYLVGDDMREEEWKWLTGERPNYGDTIEEAD
ncbi:hypothetical protein I350_06527 [Cryptococcus amylolentus CBS 6273]|uniref:Uncharacterized protein n=1 Tax=Cryptococcus amylolentus CBS 6273 TaxID=1296118 RepID=A0A1E3JLE1_9TREE|nr:hypothetical protein I350_06527 [Cryptococcus amylolentus CBS 6273]